MSHLRVLISGASVAGPALAYWLARVGCRVTVVERAAALRTEGQGIDVRDAARDVIKRMGIFDTIRDRSSHEAGVTAVDSNNKVYARFAVDETSGRGDSPTSDIEILRGELSQILYDVTKNDATYIFDEMVERIEETENETKVHFSNATPTQSFDLVVAADGIGSRIRSMAFGANAARIRSLGAYVSYFSIPLGETDNSWSRVHWHHGGRSLVLRPDNIGRTRAFCMVLGSGESDPRILKCEKAVKEGVAAQKALTQELFQDAGWESGRILKGMQASDDLYFQHIAQVRMDRWSKGRVALVGDAGYAPSPFTGMGTSVAFLGAYVLAGEISRQPNNIPAALASYERTLRPHVDSVQTLAPGIPWIALPQSKLGVRLLTTFVWLMSALAGSPVGAVFGKLFTLLPWNEKVFTLPECTAFKESEKIHIKKAIA